MYSSGIANDGGIALTLQGDVVVDQVGMSPGSAFSEGMHLAPLPANVNQSYERKPGGSNGSSQDTTDNFNDFQLISPSDPQNVNSNPTPGPSPIPSPSPSPGSARSGFVKAGREWWELFVLVRDLSGIRFKVRGAVPRGPAQMFNPVPEDGPLTIARHAGARSV